MEKRLHPKYPKKEYQNLIEDYVSPPTMDTGYIKPISICKRCFWSIPLNTGKHLIYKCGNGIECMNQNQYKELKSSDKIEDDIKTRKEREKKMEDMEGMEEINMPVAGEIELPRLNLEPYIGRKSRIAEVKAYKGKYGYVLKVSTEPLDELTTANGEKRPLRASRLFGLYQNDAVESKPDARYSTRKHEHY